MLNKSLHPDCQLTNIDHTLQMMDFDGTGTVNINEFFEVCRIPSRIMTNRTEHIACMSYRPSAFWMPRTARWTA